MTTFQDVAGVDPSTTRYRTVAALRDHGVLSRAGLARATSLAPSTITAVVRGLSDEGLVVEAGPPAGGRGTALRVKGQLATVAGVDFGFRTVRLLVADVHATELARAERALPDGYDSARGLQVVREMIDDTLGASGLAGRALSGIGVALPGPVDSERQEVAPSSVLPGWARTTASAVSAALGAPAVIENDANLAALGEHVYGAGRQGSSTLTVKIHSGIGAGIVLGDRLVTGSAGGAGEIGHVLVDRLGPLCRCGKRGCLDTVAAVPAVLASMSPLHPGLRFADFLAMVAADDPGARRIAADAAELVGGVVATACLLLAPDTVVVVGALARAGEVVVEPVRRAVQEAAVPGRAAPVVTAGQLGDRHTAMGAVALALGGLGWRRMAGAKALLP